MPERRTHQTSTARPGGPTDRRPKPPAPPPPPKWHSYLIWIGIGLTVLLLLRPLMSGPGVATLTYTQFKNDVGQNKVRSVSIDANGAVTGVLKDGTSFDSQIPVAVTDNQLIPILQAHRIQITA